MHLGGFAHQERGRTSGEGGAGWQSDCGRVGIDDRAARAAAVEQSADKRLQDTGAEIDADNHRADRDARQEQARMLLGSDLLIAVTDDHPCNEFFSLRRSIHRANEDLQLERLPSPTE
jgi:hypothetical protein